MSSRNSIQLRWDASSVRWMAWGDLFLGSLFAVGSVAIAASGELLGFLGFAGVAAVLLRLSWRAFAVLRSKPSTLQRSDDGAITITHPVWAEPMRIGTEDVHSLWIEPFEEERPLTRREFWVGRANPLGGVADVAGPLSKPSETRRVLVVTNSLMSCPRLRIHEGWFALHRTAPPIRLVFELRALRAVTEVSGIVVTPTDDDTSSAVFGECLRQGVSMPDDVRAWIA